MAETAVVSAKVDFAKIDTKVTEQLLKMAGGHYDFDVGQRARESEQLILTELAKQGFTDEQLAAIQTKIQKATFSSIAESAIQEEEDVTLAVMALQAKSEELGVEYKALGTRNEEELAQVAKALQELEDAKAALKAAKESGGWFAWSKASKIRAAELAVLEAETEYARVDKETLAAARVRLNKVNWDAKFQAYIVQALGVRDILEHRLVHIIVPGIELTETKLKDAYEQRETSSKKLEELTKHIRDLERQLSSAKADLGQFDKEADASDFAIAHRRVNELTAELLVASENKDVALSTLHTMERAVDTHEGERVALLQLRKAERVLSNVLTKTTEERIVSFKISLDVLKVGADLDQSANIAKIGEELDLSNLERVMSIGHSAQRLILDMFERQPGQVLKQAQLQQASVREHLLHHDRYEVLAKHARERYGIDIMAGLYDPNAQPAEL